jgi:predicted DNA-binding transcriptional regulator YafY
MGTGDRVETLASLSQLLDHLPPSSFIARALRDATAHPTEPLPPELASLARRVLLRPTTGAPPNVHALVRPAIFAACEEAFVGCLMIRIDYVKASRETSIRVIEPHGLLLHGNVWHVVAFDRGRAAGRSFRMDRMRSAEVLPKPFVPTNVLELFQEPM